MFMTGAFRTFPYMGSTTLSTSAGNGILNIDDKKNYMTPFMLKANTAADFYLNNVLIPGSAGVRIKDEGLYTTKIGDGSGGFRYKTFCFFNTFRNTIETDSSPDNIISSIDYKTISNNTYNSVYLFSDTAMVAYVLSGSIEKFSGIIWNRSYSKVEDYVAIKILPDRLFRIYNDAAYWTANQAMLVGHIVRPTTDNGFYYKATQVGTTGGAEPTWPTTVGATVADNTVIWQCYEGNRELLEERQLTI